MSEMKTFALPFNESYQYLIDALSLAYPEHMGFKGQTLKNELMHGMSMLIAYAEDENISLPQAYVRLITDRDFFALMYMKQRSLSNTFDNLKTPGSNVAVVKPKKEIKQVKEKTTQNRSLDPVKKNTLLESEENEDVFVMPVVLDEEEQDSGGIAEVVKEDDSNFADTFKSFKLS